MSDERLARVAELEARLENGFALIDQRRASGEDIERWETRWLKLLAEYEALCDELRADGGTA